MYSILEQRRRARQTHAVAGGMSYLIISCNNEEIDRRALDRTLVIGREATCSLCVRDIQLSRRHCHLTRSADDWLIHDLESRNGTFVNGRRVWKQRLEDGDLVRIGRTRLTFRAGEVELPTHSLPGKRGKRRPNTPAELLGETLTAFDYSDPEEQVDSRALYPRPRPVHPDSYETDGVQDMLDMIASSSWDSILMENSRPLVMERVMPRPIVRKPGEAPPRAAPVQRRRREADVSLQARIDPKHVQIAPLQRAMTHLKTRKSMWIAAGMVWLAAVIFAVEGVMHG